jgi:photosystem II stability/assembly factor-like uncharacterized protein
MSIRTAGLAVAVLVLGGLGLAAFLNEDPSGLGNVPNVPGGGIEVEAGESEGGALSPVGDWLFARRSGEQAVERARAYAAALEYAAGTLLRTEAVAPGLAAAAWQHMGPKELGGRVTDIAIDPERPDTVYAGTGSGGVWKSDDGGLNWSPSWPPELPQAIGGLAAAPDGTLYAGTGEPTPAGGYVVSSGRGVFRSEDGGVTWTPSGGLGRSGAIGRIAVDPRDPSRVFAAASGSPLFPGGERGLYRSTNAGASWVPVLRGETPTAGAIDVAVDPEDGRNVLAAMWDRDILGRRLAGSGSGLYRSSDGGDTWEEVSLPGNVPPQQVGRIGVAYAPSQPSRAYAVVASDRGGEAVGLWRSDDGGERWERAGASPDSLLQANYGWWFGRIWVDPRDHDRVFVGGVLPLESTDGGESFTPHGSTSGPALPGGEQATVHFNQHAMAWDPARPARVYLGNDGGMFRSNGDAHSATWVSAVSQGWTQHYSVAGTSWTASTARRVSHVEPTEDNPLGTVTAVSAAPSDPRVVYAGTPDGVLWRTEDGGEHWDQLEDDDLPPAEVAQIVVDPADPAVAVVVHAGSPADAAHVVSTSDGGETWQDIESDLPNAPVNDVVVLPDDRLAVASDVGVFLTRGATWLSVGSNLPEVPVLDLRYDADTGSLTAATFGHGILRAKLP